MDMLPSFTQAAVSSRPQHLVEHSLVKALKPDLPNLLAHANVLIELETYA